MKPLFEDLRTEEQRALAETVRRFVKDELRPYLASSPEDEFPRPLFSRLCAMGLGGIPFPAEYGGGGADYATYALVLEELAVAGGALAGTLSVHGLPQLILTRFGNDEQKRRYLPRLAERRAARRIRSDRARDGLRRRGDRDARGEGRRRLRPRREQGLDHALDGGRPLRPLRPDGGEGDLRVSRREGPRASRPFRRRGSSGLRRSPTGALSLAGVRVPATSLVGRPGDGLGIALTALDSGRITIGALAVGLCRGALEAALGYVKTRKAFGRPLEKNDVVRARLAEMAARTEAAAALVREAARLRDSTGRSRPRPRRRSSSRPTRPSS